MVSSLVSVDIELIPVTAVLVGIVTSIVSEHVLVPVVVLIKLLLF